MQAINLKTNCVTVKVQKQGTRMFRCSYTRSLHVFLYLGLGPQRKYNYIKIQLILLDKIQENYDRVELKTKVTNKILDLLKVSDFWLVGFMVLNATFNNISIISWRSVL